MESPQDIKTKEMSDTILAFSTYIATKDFSHC